MARLSSLLLLFVSVAMADTWNMAPGGGVHGGGGGGTIPSVAEGFEGTGAPTFWSDISTGGLTVNWDYTAAPLVGAQSLFLQDSAANNRTALYDFPGQVDEFWVAWRYKPSADPATNVGIINIIDVATNGLAFIRTQTNGTVVIVVNATQSATLIDMAPGTEYRFKVRWKKATVAANDEELEVWVAANSDGAWGASVSQLNGTSTAQADAVYFQMAAAYNMDQTIDNVLVKLSDIAWSELN
jgi:hypothetical protein